MRRPILVLVHTEEIRRAFAGKTGAPVRVDRVTRELYATDASPYRIVPAAVIRPTQVDDIGAALAVCRELGLSITPRGAGTSFTGQCVGPGLQLDCASLDGIEWIDPERRIARVQPGATWWELNRRASEHHLLYGPDPATRRQCTVGGMTATNSGGTHSIVYGAAVDHVHAVEVVFADGATARLEASGDGTLTGGGVPSDIAVGLEEARRAAAPLLGPQFSTLARRGSGYQLEHLCGDSPHMGKFIAGSEGTLALLTAIEVTLDPLPAKKVLAVCAFEDLHAAIGAVPSLVETMPYAVEVVSKSMIDIARRDPFHSRNVASMDPDAGAVLFVEYHGDSEAEAVAGFDRMDRALASAPGVRARDRYVDPRAQLAMWAVREAGIGALSSVAGGPNLPQAFVEDTIVAVDRLPPFIKELDALFARHQMDVVWYGHAATGLVHVRPFLDLSSGRDLERLNDLMRDTVDLIRDWAGDFSGEHGDGLARTCWNERLFGTPLYEQLRAIKHAFDPSGLLNPGKVVDGQQPTDNMRYGTAYRRHSLPVSVGFDDYGGYAAGAERCFGAGVCRKRGTGVMCPPAAATGLEEHSTRARANLLRSVVAGELSLSDLGSDEAFEVMDTCVGCKACKTECPARVDMARMKAVWADGMKKTPFQRNVASLRALSEFGLKMPRLTNRVLGSRIFRGLLKIAKQRRLPALAPVPLTEMLAPGTVGPMLYPDCFTTFQEPEIGIAAAGLLQGNMSLAPAGCCGRVMLSEGFVDRARAAAEYSAISLRSTSGPILFAEPSCMSMVTDDWEHLIGDVADIADRCVSAESYVAENSDNLPFRSGGEVLFHPHCHQRALWGAEGTVGALRRVGDLEIEIPDSGCCGMAGGFGYRADRYDLSVAMGERVLAPAVRATAKDAEIVATGTSCRHQIADLTGRRAVHPLVFLYERLRTQ